MEPFIKFSLYARQETKAIVPSKKYHRDVSPCNGVMIPVREPLPPTRRDARSVTLRVKYDVGERTRL